MTCLGALLSPWLMWAICDIWMQNGEDKKSEKKTRCSYFSLMMLLCAWRPRPKYLSHNSDLMLGRQHYCSAGGRVNAYLAHSPTPRQLVVGFKMSWSCIPHWYIFVCWKLEANSFILNRGMYFHSVCLFINSSSKVANLEWKTGAFWGNAPDS